MNMAAESDSIDDPSEDHLRELGVNIIDQEVLEDEILRGLEEKAAIESLEQQKKFAERELNQLEVEVRRTSSDISSITKQLQHLLSKPLNDVILQVKTLQETQSEKKNRLKILQDKVKDLKKKISNNDFNDLESFQIDQLFDSTDQVEKLKQMRSQSTSKTKSHDNHMTQKDTPSLALADFDWLGISGRSKGKGPAKTKKRKFISETFSSKSGSHTSEHENENESTTSSSITNNDGRGFEDHGRAFEDHGRGFEDHGRGSEDDSSYITDDDMGSSKGKVKRIRKWSSDESDGELIHVNWFEKKKKKKLNKRILSDDGDDELYRQRMKKYKEDSSISNEMIEVEDGYRVPADIWDRLYRYQQTGVKWLWELHCQQVGGILGDEMGLGKTIQVIGFLAGLRCSNVRSHVTRELGLGPVLVVCPATVLYQWVNEFHKWYPPFRVAILHDTGSHGGNKLSLLANIIRYNGVIITTYASIRINNLLLLKYQWDYVILDEGHKIRNPDAEITLACKRFSTPHRIILSGSPIQNNLKELWSLFDFIYPEKLGTLPVFMEQFSVPITLGGYANASKIQVETAYRCAVILRDTISPYLIRRLKSDVKIQLPNKNEQVLFCRLTDYQRELYEEYIKGPEVESMINGGKLIFSGLMTLRKLCNHPDLITKEYTKYNQEIDDDDDDDDGMCHHMLSSRGVAEGNEEVYGHWRRSGKMIVIEALLKLWFKQQHKVLLFTQSRQMLTIMRQFLDNQRYVYVMMDGTTSVGSRQTIIKDFNEDQSIFIFLMTTRVGGLGVNLTGADRVIIYDPDWNPSTDIQARERAWRIGQDKPVTIYRLITSGTIEEKIYHRQIFKQFLTNRVLRDPRQRRFFKSNNLYELFSLGSSDGAIKTETSAILAGTGSEMTISKKKKRLHRTDVNSDQTDVNSDHTESRCVNPDHVDSSKVLKKRSRSDQDDYELYSQRKNKHSKKKRKKRKHGKDVEIDGEVIDGLETVDTYNPGNEDEANVTSNKQDNMILKQLFKRSGVDTVIHHDKVISGGDPDALIVESEADKIAQSAAKALKESCRQCHSDSGGSTRGQITWTGAHGTIGAPRFGDVTSSVGDDKVSPGSGSLSLSSSVLLNKMKSRNALTLPDNQTSLHSNASSDLIRDIRSFIAHQAKRPGQATTNEILKKFGSRLAPTDSALFRSLLHKICDFHRYHGDGIWTLKSDYR